MNKLVFIGVRLFHTHYSMGKCQFWSTLRFLSDISLSFPDDRCFVSCWLQMKMLGNIWKAKRQLVLVWDCVDRNCFHCQVTISPLCVCLFLQVIAGQSWAFFSWDISSLDNVFFCGFLMEMLQNNWQACKGCLWLVWVRLLFVSMYTSVTRAWVKMVE